MTERSHLATSDADTSTGAHRLAYVGLLLFTFLLYVRPNEMFPGTVGAFPIVKIVGAVTIAAYVVSRLIRGEKLTIWPLELKMVALIVLLGLIFIPIAASPQYSIDMLTDPFLKVVLIFVMMINLLDTHKRLLLILKLVVLCGTLMAILALRSYLSGDFGTAGIRIAGAVGGTFGNPNDMATNFDLLLPLAVSLTILNRGLKRMIYLACSVLLVVGVVVTFSRGGFLGLAAAGLVMLWKLGRGSRIRTAIIFVVLLLTFVVAVPAEYTGRLGSIFNSEEDTTGSRRQRAELFERAIDVASDHLVVGVGIGNYPIYSLRELHAHNSYLEISAELGLLGLIAYLILIFAPLRSLRRIEHATMNHRISPVAHAPPETKGEVNSFYISVAIQASLAAYIVCSFFGSIQYLWYLYYIAAYAIALRSLQTQNQIADESEKAATEKVGVLWRDKQATVAAPPQLEAETQMHFQGVKRLR